MGSDPKKIRVLFFAEAVTLAHVARPVALARLLDPARYEIHLAAAPRYEALFGPLPFHLHGLGSIAPESFARRLREGRPIFDLPTLRGYAAEDLTLIERIDPDLVIGDFRLSLAASAPAAGKPYLALVNAYWSPYARQRFTVPELPLTALIGVRASQAAFDLVRPWVFAWHSRPLNRLRRLYGLPELGPDLLRVYTQADQVLYPDLPDLVPTYGRPASHRYVGPLPWSPAGPPPEWWDRLPEDRPRLYLTLGSSGDARLLAHLVEELGGLPVTLMIATAGARLRLPRLANVRVAEYLPGQAACRRAELVICNGGSPTAHQALAAGVPVLGLPRNLDQYLNMSFLEQAGVGLALRSDSLKAGQVRAAVSRLLGEPSFRAAAEAIRVKMAAFPTARAVEDALEEALGGGSTAFAR